MSRLISLAKHREIRTVIFLILLFLIVGIVNPDFVTVANIENAVKNSLLYIVLAAGITFVLLTGEIDISVGGILGLSAAVSGMFLRDGGSIFLAILIAIVIGGVIGLINGLGVTKLRISSFIMTLGMLEIARVVQVIYTNGKWVENLPKTFKEISQSSILGINTLGVIVIIAVILIHFFLVNSRKGRYFAAIGDNQDGAVLIGIPVKRYKVFAFVISGICAAVAGLIFASQIGFISTTAGIGIEMTVIAAAVLGGVSLSGGIGSVIGASVGAIIMSSINSALVFLKVPAFWNSAISGLLLILIVVADVLIVRRANKKANKERLNARVLNYQEGA
ncbi:ABC transporter permease [Cytobacillus solani]|uniref:Autoinducer 2 import system permease protein LsrC n=1 Tax=Cytobacillus solani TaxID=1637975 RepID=A0A0Q3QVG9_9BACI|nr:sugar ABC transporter permease [Cytobacillus solani]KOP71694.1 sugar ABC transporter permease [Bacillus sp. FJAT-21945]KQL21632.1 sugar ABC transporter permease [Cytobacillus solani]USK54943.1 sugar ABC transporter permease [Cytobacillus solani]